MKAQQFYALTGYQFRQIELLEQALTHRSYARRDNNERLEFLGDSILNLIISNHIYTRYETAAEGELSRIRASLVKQATLAEIAREINLGDFIKLGGGELKSGGYRRDSILSDALEALIGAVYLDSEYPQVERVVLGLYQKQLGRLDVGKVLKDPKTRLQEFLQAQKMNLPAYAIVDTRGKSHNQTFTVSCRLDELEIEASGQGSSRKQAEQQAAQRVLAKLET